MKSVMQNQFQQVPKAEIERSSFDRSHGYKCTFNAGLLIPFYVDEALPGDTFNLKATAFIRLATPIKPVMDNIFIDTFFFAVPYRLVWDNWHKFNGERENATDNNDFTIPQISITTQSVAESIYDYMGIPTGVSGLSINALPFRAYNLIVHEWFRDQNLYPTYKPGKGDGPDNASLYNLFRTAKRRDYFTSALPWPQKGEEILLPLGSEAAVVSNGAIAQVTGGGRNMAVSWVNNVPTITASGDSGGLPSDFIWGPETGLKANLGTATASSINNLREAFQLQRMFERDARGGTRYTEIIRSHFGVQSPDMRMQRPEYLGGGTSPINFHPVPQTSPSGTYADTPQGNVSAYAVGGFNNHGFTKSFTEHCIILGLMRARADVTYQQSLNKMWSRLTRFDHYWPALAHLGEQPIKNREIFAQGTAGGTADDGTFGYQERYAEYRYKPSIICGKFKSTHSTPLDVYHLSQEFASLPTLNTEFIEEKPPMERILAVTDESDFLFDGYISLKCARPMPLFGVPGYMDHF